MMTRRLWSLLAILLVFPAFAQAQVRVSPPQVGRPVTSLPTSCSKPEVVFLLVGTVGLHQATNDPGDACVWEEVAAGGGGGGAITCLDTGVLFSDGADNPVCDAGFTYAAGTLTSPRGVLSGTGSAAVLTTALAGANNDLVYTAVTVGSTGNAIAVQYFDAGPSSSLLVEFLSMYTFVVTLATNGGGAITSTADDVATAMNAVLGGLVVVTNAPGNDGSGVVTAMALTSLAGGTDALTLSGPLTAPSFDIANGAFSWNPEFTPMLLLRGHGTDAPGTVSKFLDDQSGNGGLTIYGISTLLNVDDAVLNFTAIGAPQSQNWGNPGPVLTGSTIGQMVFTGWDGSTLHQSANFNLSALQTFNVSTAVRYTMDFEAGSLWEVTGATLTLDSPVTASAFISTDGGAFGPSTTDAHTALLRAYDVDGTAYKTFATLTNGNTPDFTIAPPAGGTVTLTTTLFTSSGAGMAVANVGANSCGTTAATIAGNSNSFEITVGATAGTQCRVAFPTAAPNRWNCVSNNTTTANLARSTPVDTTHVDFLGTFSGGDVVSGVCIPR